MQDIFWKAYKVNIYMRNMDVDICGYNLWTGGAENVSWSWLSILRGWESLAMVFLGQFEYISVYKYLCYLCIWIHTCVTMAITVGTTRNWLFWAGAYLTNHRKTIIKQRGCFEQVFSFSNNHNSQHTVTLLYLYFF